MIRSLHDCQLLRLVRAVEVIPPSFSLVVEGWTRVPWGGKVLIILLWQIRVSIVDINVLNELANCLRLQLSEPEQ